MEEPSEPERVSGGGADQAKGAMGSLPQDLLRWAGRCLRDILVTDTDTDTAGPDLVSPSMVGSSLGADRERTGHCPARAGPAGWPGAVGSEGQRVHPSRVPTTPALPSLEGQEVGTMVLHTTTAHAGAGVDPRVHPGAAQRPLRSLDVTPTLGCAGPRALALESDDLGSELFSPGPEGMGVGWVMHSDLYFPSVTLAPWAL